MFTKNFAIVCAKLIILQDLQYFSQPACKTDFAQVFIFWFGYTSKEHACLNGRVYGNSPRPLQTFFFWRGGGGGGVIRDKIGINLLLRPLLWALKNRYI